MRVLIDGHMLGTGEGGNERYIKNLVLALRSTKIVKLKALVPNTFFQKTKKDKNLSRVLVKQSFDSNVARLFYNLPSLSARFKADIIHSTYISPFIKNAKFVVTVHDFSFCHFPEFFSLREKLIFKYLLPLSLRRADAVIVPSAFSRREAIKFYPELKDKMFVTPEAAEEIFKLKDKRSALRLLKKRYGIVPPFLLTLNSKNPKKNVNRVIDAFGILRETFPALSLVIIGRGFNIKKPRGKLGNVRILGQISDKDLVLFYNACEVFIYYSLYEGFGLPILEALKCKSSVIASDIEVHRELTKDSILYASPLNPGDLSRKIKKLLEDRNTKERIREQGFRIANLYSWEKTAIETLKVYKSVLV